jgi:hypothetical protein
MPNEGTETPRGEVREFASHKLSPKALAAIYLMTVALLGVTVVAALIGAIWLTLLGEEIPDLLVSFGSAAIGALAGMLAPTANT